MATVRLRNVNPLGDVDIPSIGHVPAGGEFDGPEELLEQVGNYALVSTDQPVPAPADHEETTQ
jgi:hypothetical protein